MLYKGKTSGGEKATINTAESCAIPCSLHKRHTGSQAVRWERYFAMTFQYAMNMLSRKIPHHMEAFLF